jgi:hypothetical protein
MDTNKFPIPEAKNGAPAKYPWRTMDIGDSFLAPGKSINGQATHAAQRTGRKFTVRKVADGWRVWRIA